MRSSIELRLPQPIVSAEGGFDPEEEALLADSVGLAMLVVLDTLTPPERIAFVLHDTFGLPFDEIAPLIERTPPAARQLASRARRRIQRAPLPDARLDRQWEMVDAFLAASREGDFQALLAVLDPEVVLRIDRGSRRGGGYEEVHGAAAVARRGVGFSALAPFARRALVNGAAGLVVRQASRLLGVVGFTVVDGKIVEVDLLMDPVRLSALPAGEL